MPNRYLLVYQNNFTDSFEAIQQLMDSIPLLKLEEEFIDHEKGCIIFRVNGDLAVLCILAAMLDEGGFKEKSYLYEQKAWS